jgi:hypothetical protein
METLLASKQTLQTAEEIMLPLEAALRSTAARLAAARPCIAGGLRTTVASTTGRFSTSIAGTAAGLAASTAGIAAGLAARGTALVAEHLVKELETKRLTTNGNAENQRTEEQHTLHRATSPLLVDHVRVFVPIARCRHPEVVIHELSCGRPVEPFRDSKYFQVTAAPWLPDGHSDCPGGHEWLSAGRGKRLEQHPSIFRCWTCGELWAKNAVCAALRICAAQCHRTVTD